MALQVALYVALPVALQAVLPVAYYLVGGDDSNVDQALLPDA